MEEATFDLIIEFKYRVFNQHWRSNIVVDTSARSFGLLLIVNNSEWKV